MSLLLALFDRAEPAHFNGLIDDRYLVG